MLSGNTVPCSFFFGVLQCVTQCVAVCCNVFQCTARFSFSVSKCVCSAFQCVLWIALALAFRWRSRGRAAVVEWSLSESFELKHPWAPYVLLHTRTHAHTHTHTHTHTHCTHDSLNSACSLETRLQNLSMLYVVFSAPARRRERKKNWAIERRANEMKQTRWTQKKWEQKKWKQKKRKQKIWKQKKWKQKRTAKKP